MNPDPENKPSYMELYYLAKKMSMMDDIYEMAKSIKQITSVVEKKVVELLGNENKKLVMTVLDHPENYATSVMDIAKKKSLIGGDVMNELIQVVTKTVFTYEPIAKMVIEKDKRMTELQKLSAENVKSLGGDVGGLVRSIMKSYMSGLDLLGRELLVRKAYTDLNRRGFFVLNEIVNTMGGTVYMNKNIGPFLFELVLVTDRQNDTVKTLDDMTDDELLSLKAYDKFFSSESETEHQKIKSTIAKNDLDRKMQELSTVYRSLPFGVTKNVPMGKILNAIQESYGDPWQISGLAFEISTLKSHYDSNYDTLSSNTNMLISSLPDTLTADDLARLVPNVERDMRFIIDFGDQIKSDLNPNNIVRPLCDSVLAELQELSNPSPKKKSRSKKKEVQQPASISTSMLAQSSLGITVQKSVIVGILTKYMKNVGTLFMESNMALSGARMKLITLMDDIRVLLKSMQKDNLGGPKPQVAPLRPVKKLILPEGLTDDLEKSIGRMQADKNYSKPAFDVAKEISTQTRRYKMGADNINSLNAFIKSATDKKKRFILIPIVIIPTKLLSSQTTINDDELHANIVIIDTKKKNVEFYAPHGVDELTPGMITKLEDIFCRKAKNPSQIKQSAKLPASAQKQKLEMASILPSDSISEPASLLPSQSVQTGRKRKGKKDTQIESVPVIELTPKRITVLQNYTFKIITRKFYRSGWGAQTISSYPYCLSWCFYVALLRVLHPAESFEEIEAMSKSQPFDIETQPVNLIETTPANVRFKNLDACDLKNRIENFTIYMHRMANSMFQSNKQRVSGAMGIPSNPSNTGAPGTGLPPVTDNLMFGLSPEGVLDVVSNVTMNSQLALSDRSDIIPFINIQRGGDGQINITHTKIKI
ncbi:hypothetical protein YASMINEVIRUS_434 [Yasminevirus sp. GU-2018]|uniref:Uncharacterized protein n=1 Tax=Yasminevirus sp. GU-2018 TaxID=2420051 RepID=A0A5K0U8V1_9VIRU|nr:hypothetical protein YASMINEVIRUS_434 [Yasminevirus sp. GU-2018]